MFMRVDVPILVCAAAVAVAEAGAADLSAVFTDQQSPMPYITPREAEPAEFWGLFDVALNQRAPGVFQDQFNPLNFRNFTSLADGDIRHLPDYNPNNARMAMHAFSSVSRSSAKEAALELDLPILEWLREQQGFLADFLWNSYDNVEGRSVSPLDWSYQSDERSWWNEQPDSNSLHYGLRLFRTDPYAYFSWRFKDGEHVWLLGDARYYCRISGGQHIELTLSTPVMDGLSIEFDTSCDIGMHQAEKKAALRMLKTFKGGGFLEVALEARQQPRLTASITMPW
jgi:hypothetical protein